MSPLHGCNDSDRATVDKGDACPGKSPKSRYSRVRKGVENPKGWVSGHFTLSADAKGADSSQQTVFPVSYNNAQALEDETICILIHCSEKTKKASDPVGRALASPSRRPSSIHNVLKLQFSLDLGHSDPDLQSGQDYSRGQPMPGGDHLRSALVSVPALGTCENPSLDSS
ncbi:hypothetical protein PoB_001131100 [Plakobranchus ocellatus]|uniref:Uncharacterized protein n=1 Tax=Plakobranchus ocellatus TaxID=259542 RepID=A0AAV3YQZ0_9GAST|nr:hypothetical protein PoB_001131100 [Plakobranchus ocellatus]